MLKLIALLAVLALAAVIVIALMRPDEFRVARSIRIAAPPERIFPLINDLQLFREWSPFENKDPAMRRTFSGPAAGQGALYEFDGNSQVGRGRLEIVQSTPPGGVTMRLDMLAPIEGHNVVEFTLEPQGAATQVTWAMHGPMPFVSKLLSVFINMDRMVGTDFEAGLATLKAVVERQGETS